MEDREDVAIPQWQSHKKVWGDKIVAVFDESPSMVGHWELLCGETVVVSIQLAHRVPVGVNPVGGYYVLYEDGFESWSPAKAFEEGYALLQAQVINPTLENNFTYHAPKEGQPAKYGALRAKAKELSYLITNLTPPSREQSVAMTQLETAIFWANAAIARNE